MKRIPKTVVAMLMVVTCITGMAIITNASTADTWHLTYTNTNYGNRIYETMDLVGASTYKATVTSRTGSYDTDITINGTTKRVYGPNSYRKFYNCSSASTASARLLYTSGGGAGTSVGSITY